ncbi:MAG: tail fiber domain-containing protein, partial [Acidobacteria bacterium]|nr:tail fiber domain-containing protein [Acidobacteriota bacterium]
SGYIGFGVANPAYPIHHSNGARLTTGGVWTDASSRLLKQDIETLDADAAMAAFKELEPVTYAYRADPTEHHAGFIAEDVPDLVAANDRTGLAPMDVVAVLTKVVQEQQKTIEKLEARLAELEAAKK